ncbi:hypothetical protein ACFL5O_00095 [Myxococcota bacterium]
MNICQAASAQNLQVELCWEALTDLGRLADCVSEFMTAAEHYGARPFTFRRSPTAVPTTGHWQ